MRLAAHALAAAALIVLPALWLAPPPLWRMSMPQWLVLATFAAAYLLCAGALRRTSRGGTVPSISHVLLVGAAAFGGCLAAVIFSESLLPQAFPDGFPRQALATSILLGLLALVLSHATPSTGAAAHVFLAVILLAGMAGHAAYYKGWLPRFRPPQPARFVSHVDSSLYLLKLTAYAHWVPKSARHGGGLTRWRSDYLLANGDGELFVIRENRSHGSLDVTRLPRTVPFNPEEFVAGAREVFRDSPSQYVPANRFRVADVLTQERGRTARLLVSHHFWHRERRCFVMRLSMLEGTREQIASANAPVQWQTVYETSPCLTLDMDGPAGVRFEGFENGGQLAFLNDNELLLSVGDHAFDGVNRAEQLAQDAASSYGKIVRLRLDSRQADVYSLGHRNPQGLYVDARGVIWETEHGPRGGDELNVIREGANYGWPLVVYGTDYARLSWPLNAAQGKHEGFEKPVLAFVPSVAVSSLTGVTSPLFPLWQDDLLIATLKGRTLWRTRIEEGRAIFSEPIPIGQPIRDILIGHDGRIILWTDNGEIVFIEPAETQAGDALIAQCTGCHGLNSWDMSTVGPNLWQIIDRPVASRKDFAYSEAMRKFGGRWTRKRLDAFLASPQGAIPGSSMQFDGINDADERKQLLDYLQSLPTRQ